MMLADAHVHLGQFHDIYTSPSDLSVFLESIGIDIVAVSSTTTCENDFLKVQQEMEEFIEFYPGRTIPVLWATPELLQMDSVIRRMLNGKVKWECIKVHPQLSPNEWYADSANYQVILDLANSISVPILIHTGVVKNCHPLQIASVFVDHPYQKFIMAHGRPIEEAMRVLEMCPNTVVDTAFMPLDHIKLLIEGGYTERVLWGSDYPIIKYYERDVDYKKDYLHQLSVLKKAIGEEAFVKITYTNITENFPTKKIKK